MASNTVIQVIERQHWLEPLADRLQALLTDGVAAADPAGQQVANALHGVWLGHPLHPVLTDVPLGFWTAAEDTLRGQRTAALAGGGKLASLISARRPLLWR
jgi:hypothetical protein